MSTATRKPKVGDLVIVHDDALEEDFIGTVIDLLSVQFTYSVQLTSWRTALKFCQYSDEWADYDPTPE